MPISLRYMRTGSSMPTMSAASASSSSWVGSSASAEVELGGRLLPGLAVGLGDRDVHAELVGDAQAGRRRAARPRRSWGSRASVVDAAALAALEHGGDEQACLWDRGPSVVLLGLRLVTGGCGGALRRRWKATSGVAGGGRAQRAGAGGPARRWTRSLGGGVGRRPPPRPARRACTRRARSMRLRSRRQQALVDGLVERLLGLGQRGRRGRRACGPAPRGSARASPGSRPLESPSGSASRSARMARHSSRAGVVTMPRPAADRATRSWREGWTSSSRSSGRLDGLERALDRLRVEGAGAGQDGVEVDLRPPAWAPSGAAARSPAPRSSGARARPPRLAQRLQQDALVDAGAA